MPLMVATRAPQFGSALFEQQIVGGSIEIANRIGDWAASASRGPDPYLLKEILRSLARTTRTQEAQQGGPVLE
jgi:hypothetical protein